MFMRITWGHVRPGAWAEFLAQYESVADPNTAGLVARWVVQDSNDVDSFFALTLWKRAEDIRTWETSDDYRKHFLPTVSRFMDGSYSVSTCEVKYTSAGGLNLTPNFGTASTQDKAE